MLAGYLPFDDDPANPEGDNINLLYKYITQTPLTFPEYVSAMARDLLRQILSTISSTLFQTNLRTQTRRANDFETSQSSYVALPSPLTFPQTNYRFRSPGEGSCYSSVSNSDGTISLCSRITSYLLYSFIIVSSRRHRWKGSFSSVEHRVTVNDIGSETSYRPSRIRQTNSKCNSRRYVATRKEDRIGNTSWKETSSKRGARNVSIRSTTCPCVSTKCNNWLHYAKTNCPRYRR